MIFRLRSWIGFSLTLIVASVSPAAPAVTPAPFLEPEQPFVQTQLQIIAPDDSENRAANFVVRGILFPLSPEHAVVFDQELMRVAGFWSVPPGSPSITLETMPQISYANPKAKAYTKHPEPTGVVLLSTGMHPGVSGDLETLLVDPRAPGRKGDVGRGPLPADFARFSGVQLANTTAILHYTSGQTAIREWFEVQSLEASAEKIFLRHFEFSPHAQPVHVALGAAKNAGWQLHAGGAFAASATGELTRIGVNTDVSTFSVHSGELIATLAPSEKLQRVTFAIAFSQPSPTAAQGASVEPALLAVSATPPLPASTRTRRWQGSVGSSAQLESLAQNGLVLDRIAVPEENPWRRRVRPADLAFLDGNRAAVVTYEGDVWTLSGLADASLDGLKWERFASGLHEPLAITAPGGIVQVATKNGVVRLHDRDANGEADWFENFNDQMIQSQNTRSFALDMAMAPDGSTYVTQGGIVDQSGIKSGGTGTPHSGGFIKISPDGRSSKLFAREAREPFVTVHPETGVVTGTDQQGHYIPSSVSYLVREGDSFGFLHQSPDNLTPPLAWIPHDQDTSSSSQVWIMGEGMGPWNGRLLHLSYGTGRLFVISPDLSAPIPQAAVIPLNLKTELPLLHARMHPAGDAVFLAGFQIWGTRTTTSWALGRLRVGTTPVVTAISARSTRDGVILEFAEPIDPASLKSENVTLRAWNYQRSAQYGSGRFTLDGKDGTNALGVGQIVASHDRKSVFIHVPNLARAMQVELRHELSLASGTPASGLVYFTINEPRSLDLASAGFPEVDLSKSVVVVTRVEEEIATPAKGKELAENFGCIACHSIDGTTEGKVGPTWRQLFGSRRSFVDGGSEVADEQYLREKILDPMKRRVMAGGGEMPSYRGVLSESQLESLVFYIRTLRRPVAGETRPQVENTLPRPKL